MTKIVDGTMWFSSLAESHFRDTSELASYLRIAAMSGSWRVNGIGSTIWATAEALEQAIDAKNNGVAPMDD